MLRALLAIVFVGAGLLVPASAWASGDLGCTVSWKLKLTGLSECNNQPLLSPANDNRVNIELLLLDAGKVHLHPQTPPRPTDRDLSSPNAGPVPFTPDDLNQRISPSPAPGPAPDSVDTSADRVEGEGSRCNSNTTGAAQFAAALAASGAPPNERTALLAARSGLAPKCADDPKASPPAMAPVQVASATGKQFAAYLAGAAAFYDGRYGAAAQSFASLRTSGRPWLKQTGRYMLGRVALNQAQAGAFDEFGRLKMDAIDPKALATARTAFEGYLHDYPQGAYATSARGLLRRIDWLGGRTTDLAQDVVQAFDVAYPRGRNVTATDLVQEADSKLLSKSDTAASAIRDPLLLAAFDLQHMRAEDAKSDPKFLSSAALNAQRPVFAGREALFDYLRAAHAIFVDNTPAAALSLSPKARPASTLTYLEFSRQVVSAMALEATGGHAKAHALWLALMPLARPPLQHSVLELGLAMNEERAGSVDQVFAAGSPITDPDLRELLLSYDAGPDLLRRQARASSVPQHERRVALYALLYKELTRSRYSAFVDDLAMLPPAEPARDDQPTPDPNFAPFRWNGQTTEGFSCPSLKALAQALAHDPAGEQDRVCLGEFVRVGGLDDSALDAPRPADELGGAPSQFPGGPYSRLESYEALLADRKTPTAVKAYVLYRAVQCYAPGGYNRCGGEGVAKSQRHAWFETLKTDYAGSAWAQRLRYYW